MTVERPKKRPKLPTCHHTPQPYVGPSREEVLALRHEYVTPGLVLYYHDPLMIVEGHMQYLFDEMGRRYLDAFAGIVSISVGHCHPQVVERVRSQTGRLQHTTTIYLHPMIGTLAKKLAEKMPATLNKTYFTNSGSEANELALLTAREYTGNQDVIALRNCYHGGTSGPLALVDQDRWKFPTMSQGSIHHTHAGYCYRCPYGLSYPSCDLKCASDIKNVIEHETSGEIACFIGESIQGVGGVIAPPKEFFQILYDLVRQHGGICVADEVQGGFGRTGKHYWSFQNWEVTPDIVVMAKGMGNGTPLGAMTTREDVAQTMKHRIHFNTFGGNPISMTQGLATLEVIDEAGMQQNASRVGTYLKNRLLDLQDRHPILGEVRGLGLMLGVELVRDQQSKEPATSETSDILEGAKTRGLLLGRGGLYDNTLRIKPPMCISQDDADFIVDCLDETIDSIS